jgi:prevent-host-death family protein
LESVVREIGAFEAKNTLGALLDLVQQGEEVVITRHGKPVARLVAETASRDPSAARAAVAIRARAAARKGAPITNEEWKSFRDEGRP